MRYKFFIVPALLAFISGCDVGEHAQFPGYVEGENIYLASPNSGILNNLNVVRGQHVEKGQLLFQLDPDPQEFTINQVKADLKQAEDLLVDLKKPRRVPEIAAIEAQIKQSEARIKLAQIRVDRQQKLLVKQATEKDTLDAAVANLDQQLQLKSQYEANLALAKLGSRDDQIAAQNDIVESLKSKLNSSKWDLEQKTLVAPDSGVIFDTYYRQGEFVPSQQAVVSLLTPKNVRIEFYLPLKYASKVKVGQNITFNCEGCDPNNKATINYVSPDAEFVPPLIYSRENYEKLVFRIRADIANPIKFKPGQPVMVNL